MSGHSKWSKIKRDKGANDAKRGAIFTRIGHQVALAAKSGADPSMNPTLALAIEKAKAANMPNANIERSIARVTDKSAAALNEVVYEGYGPGGVAVIVECATDNIHRTYPEVRNVFNKRGGSIADKGSVVYQFDHKGVIIVKVSPEQQGEDVLMTILDAGAEDAVENKEDGEIIVYTAMKDLGTVRDAIKASGLILTDAELSYEPNTTVELDDEKQEKLETMLDAFEDLADVVNTYTNLA